MRTNKNPKEVRNHVEEPIISIAGATSSELNFDYHDLPFPALLATARRFFLGHYKHGRFNWKKGDSQFAEERMKHLAAHTFKFLSYRQQEDLDALLCNAMMIADFAYRGVLSRDPVKDFMHEGKGRLDLLK